MLSNFVYFLSSFFFLLFTYLFHEFNNFSIYLNIFNKNKNNKKKKKKKKNFIFNALNYLLFFCVIHLLLFKKIQIYIVYT